MSTQNLSIIEDSNDSSAHILDIIWNKFGKIITYLVSSSDPMTRSDQVGLTITLIAMGMILSPLAFTDSDPYHIKWLMDEITEIVPLIDSVGENNRSHYTVIINLKTSQETHLDATEKIILGKYRSFTN